MDADLIAALERAAELIVNGGARCQQDAAIIRAHIETLRNGGERAQIVAWLRGIRRLRDTEHLADAIASGAHLGASDAA